MRDIKNKCEKQLLTQTNPKTVKRKKKIKVNKRLNDFSNANIFR